MTTIAEAAIARTDEHMKRCDHCRSLPADEQARRRGEIATDVVRTQSREPHQLPLAAWPLGRPWAAGKESPDTQNPFHTHRIEEPK